MSTDRQRDNLIFYKVEIYVDCLLGSEIYIISNFVKIVRAVLEIYVSWVHGQTSNEIFYKTETYLDRLHMHERHVIPCFVKIVIEVLEIYEIYVHGQTTQFFARLRPI